MAPFAVENRRLARAARQAGIPLPDGAADQEVADSVRAVVRAVFDALAPVLRDLTPALASIVAAWDELLPVPVGGRGCHCLCAVHAHYGYLCGGDADRVVTLVGGMLSPVDTPMCPACAGWWCDNRRWRVGQVSRVIPAAGR